MGAPPRSFAGETARHAARVARLPLDDDRLEIVGPTVEVVYALIDMLDAVPLGETPPATAFDARWKR